MIQVGIIISYQIQFFKFSSANFAEMRYNCVIVCSYIINSNTIDWLVKSLKDKILWFLEQIIIVVALVFSGILVVVSGVTTVAHDKVTYAEDPIVTGDNIVYNILVLIGVLLVIYLGKKIGAKYKGKYTWLLVAISIAIFFCIGFAWVILTNSEPVGDQRLVSQIAWDLWTGNYSSLQKGEYLEYYPYQLGIVVFLKYVYGFMGRERYQVFQLFNVIMASCSLFACYRITKSLCLRKTDEVLTLVLMVLCFPFIGYTSYVYGEVFSITFSLFIVCFLQEYWKEKKNRWLVLMMFCTVLAVQFKQNMLIVLIALVITLVLYALREQNREKIKVLVWALLTALVVMGAQTTISTIYFTKAGEEVSAGCPMILNIAIGLRDEGISAGWYTKYARGVYSNSGYDATEATKVGIEEIVNRIDVFVHDPSYAFVFFKEKVITQWSDPLFEVLQGTYNFDREPGALIQSIYFGDGYDVLFVFANYFQFIVYVGFFAYLWCNRKKITSNNIFLVLIFCGGFACYLLWEAKGRYVLPYFVMMIPMAAMGLGELVSKSELFIAKYINKKEM